MIPRLHRANSDLVQKTNRSGLSAHGTMVSLRLLFVNSEKTSNEPAGSWKLSVIVPKKVANTAVLRNRLRRQWYEYIRKSENLNKALSDKDVKVCIVSVRSQNSPLPEQAEQELLLLMDKASQKDRITKIK